MRNYLQGLSGEELLDRLGLMRKANAGSGVWPMVLGCGIGLAVGVTLGMAFAPKSGTEFRGELAERIRRRSEEMQRGEGPGRIAAH